MRLKSIYTLLKECNDCKTVDERVNALRERDHPVLRLILRYTFDPSIVFILPEGAPPYKPCDFLDQEGRLYVEARKLYLFVEGGNPNLTKLKREILFIQLIESIDKNDAELLINIKDKKLPFKSITKAVVTKAFPDLIPSEEKNI
ncbi:hypothetical protein EBR43_06530 [bacterium]|nr:hypothetical protein [bacterium]